MLKKVCVSPPLSPPYKRENSGMAAKDNSAISKQHGRNGVPSIPISMTTSDLDPVHHHTLSPTTTSFKAARPPVIEVNEVRCYVLPQFDSQFVKSHSNCVRIQYNIPIY